MKPRLKNEVSLLMEVQHATEEPFFSPFHNLSTQSQTFKEAKTIQVHPKEIY